MAYFNPSIRTLIIRNIVVNIFNWIRTMIIPVSSGGGGAVPWIDENGTPWVDENGIPWTET